MGFLQTTVNTHTPTVSPYDGTPLYKNNNQSTIGNVLSSVAKGMTDTYSNYVSQMASAAAIANAESRRAQEAQYAYNLDLMQRAQDFNASSAAEANRITAEMYKQAMEYNAKEAQTNREWQEKMSKTAYQRAVEDMRAAGINPILAAQNGGASIGSGSSASVGTPSASSAQGASTNVGSYSGQGYHLNDLFAMVGSALGTLGTIINSAKVQNGASKFENIVETAAESIYDFWSGETSKKEADKYYAETGNEARYLGGGLLTWIGNKK